MQICAMSIEPGLCLLEFRAKALDLTPESARVIHLDQMGGLMRGEIVEHETRRQDKTPVVEHEPQRLD